jgi:hypothetical protein
MLRILKNGFIPHHAVMENSNMRDEIRYETIKIAVEISRQANHTGPIEGTTLSINQLAAIAEIIAHELVYYHQIAEIGCFLSSALCDEENYIPPDQDLNEYSPRADQLSFPLLGQSGRIGKSLDDLLRKIGLSSNKIRLLGPAGYENDQDYPQKRKHHGLLVRALFEALRVMQTRTDISMDEVLNDLSQIATNAWKLMHLCTKHEMFRFSTPSPLFTSINIDPTESIFGKKAAANWKKITIHHHPPQNDDVLYYTAFQKEAKYGYYFHSEEAS